MFPPYVIDKVIKNYVSRQIENKEKSIANGENCTYIKLDYIGKSSKLLQKNIDDLCIRLCNDVKIKFVFTSCKIGRFFTTKDPLPKNLKSSIVYKFVCPSCNASYIGETQRHFKTRVAEHLGKDKCSHVYRHLLNNPSCLSKANEDSFTIIDTASSSYRLKVKEAPHIRWNKPNLNKQVKHYNVSISF